MFAAFQLPPRQPKLICENSENWFQGKQFSSVQLLSRVRLFVTPWTAALQASLLNLVESNMLTSGTGKKSSPIIIIFSIII